MAGVHGIETLREENGIFKPADHQLKAQYERLKAFMAAFKQALIFWSRKVACAENKSHDLIVNVIELQP